jgi:segregation and condensation protein B
MAENSEAQSFGYGGLGREQQKKLLEALLFVAWEPISAKRLGEIAGLDSGSVRELLLDLQQDYSGRGFQLVEIAGGWQFLTGKEMAPYIEKLYNPRNQQLSKAALETLAIVAYRQPVTRLEIDNIRQVKSDAVLGKLMEKSLIKEVGRLEGPGRPILYGTTREFLAAFGIASLKELPELAEVDEAQEISLYDTALAVEQADGAEIQSEVQAELQKRLQANMQTKIHPPNQADK